MNATRKRWILGGLILALIILVAAKYGEQLVSRFPNHHESAPLHDTGPLRLQPFDERLSLRMPAAFGSPTEFPLEKLPVEVRGNVQKMIQRTAYFSGVYIVVMKLTYIPGTKGKIEDILYNTFSRNANPPSPNTPKINRTYVNAKLYASASPPDLWSRAHASMDTRRSVNKKGQVTSNAGGR